MIVIVMGADCGEWLCWSWFVEDNGEVDNCNYRSRTVHGRAPTVMAFDCDCWSRM